MDTKEIEVTSRRTVSSRRVAEEAIDLSKQLDHRSWREVVPDNAHESGVYPSPVYGEPAATECDDE